VRDIELTLTVPEANERGIVALAPCEAATIASELISKLESAGYCPWSAALE
jgi:ethanolamine utilization microcompartment shell protein EutS